MLYVTLTKAKTERALPGEWRRARSRGAPIALVSCPGCGQSVSLSGHKVEATGAVSPSFGCPYAGCDYHEWIKLDGWRDE